MILSDASLAQSEQTRPEDQNKSKHVDVAMAVTCAIWACLEGWCSDVLPHLVGAHPWRPTTLPYPPFLAIDSLFWTLPRSQLYLLSPRPHNTRELNCISTQRALGTARRVSERHTELSRVRQLS
jgi:hypothetical protein